MQQYAVHRKASVHSLFVRLVAATFQRSHRDIQLQYADQQDSNELDCGEVQVIEAADGEQVELQVVEGTNGEHEGKPKVCVPLLEEAIPEPNPVHQPQQQQIRSVRHVRQPAKYKGYILYK